MPWFEWAAVDGGGRTVTGALEAADEALARRALESRRLAVLTVSASERAPRAAGTRRDRLSQKGLSLVTRQLSTLVAVAPLEEALRTLAAQAEKPSVRRILDGVHAGVLEGRRLSDAMAAQGPAFPPLYRAMVAAGEGSGSLPTILERLADHLEREAQIRGKILTALVYPIVLAVVAVAVIAALIVFVVPKVVEQFDSMGQTLPLLTRLIIGLSDLMRGYGWIGLILLIAGGFGLAAALRRPATRLRMDAALLKTPVIGRLARDLHAARLARTLSTMLASGLPLMEGLLLTAPTVTNRVQRRATEAMAEAIREGGGLSAAMTRTGVFPPLLIYMASSGESSGRLEPMLEKAADYLEREFTTFTAVALSLLEPAIIVVMGGLVALIVLSILLPILQINTLALQ